MRRRITEQDAYTGRVVTGKAPKRARPADFTITIITTKRQRWARNLWG